MRAMCGVHLNGWTGVKGLMPMFGLSETIFQVVMANNVCHVLRREDGHVLRGALELEVEDKRKK